MEEGRGHRQGHDLGLRAVLQPQVADPLPVLGEGTVVAVGAARLPDEHDGPRVHEAADVVDVPVGVVPDDAPAEPEHVGGAQPRPQRRLEALAPEARVADLDAPGQVALLGREERAAAVHVDAAPLEDEVAPADARVEEALAEQAGRRLRDAPVLPPVAVLGPGVEVEVHDRRLESDGRSAGARRPARCRASSPGWSGAGRTARAGGPLRPWPGGAGRASPRPRSRPGCAPPRRGRSSARSRRRPSGSCRACRASRWDGEASPARSPRGAPTRPAWRSPTRPASARPSLACSS